MTDTGLPEVPENFYFVVRAQRGWSPPEYVVALMERRWVTEKKYVFPRHPWYVQLWHTLTFKSDSYYEDFRKERLIEHGVRTVKYREHDGPVTVLDAESIYATAVRVLDDYQTTVDALAAQEKFLGAYPPKSLDNPTGA